MSLGFWQRIKNLLIEASIISLGAPEPLQHWGIRVEGTTFQITLRDKDGKVLSAIELIRTAPNDCSFSQGWPEGLDPPG